MNEFDDNNRELTKVEQLEWYLSYLESRISRYQYLLNKTKEELKVEKEKEKVKRLGGNLQ